MSLCNCVPVCCCVLVMLRLWSYGRHCFIPDRRHGRAPYETPSDWTAHSHVHPRVYAGPFWPIILLALLPFGCELMRVCAEPDVA
ncbi:unnamed protein product [Protopolystoma xenopodis]|uniref:Uncharacterized protein n=1 Tax=Protopolystoma xenopodis TaxID=117903 RepID=A0A448X112_9PLAT|nr:unnamed protein product [Protopolystoma xenopodis]